MQRQSSSEAVQTLSAEQREARRNRVLKRLAQLSSDPDHQRREFRATVAGQLVALLGRAGLSAAKAARKLGVSPSQLSRQLAGDHNLTLNSLHDIAAAAGARVQLHFEARTVAKAQVTATESSTVDFSTPAMAPEVPTVWRAIQHKAGSGKSSFSFDAAHLAALPAAPLHCAANDALALEAA